MACMHCFGTAQHLQPLESTAPVPAAITRGPPRLVLRPALVSGNEWNARQHYLLKAASAAAGILYSVHAKCRRWAVDTGNDVDNTLDTSRRAASALGASAAATVAIDAGLRQTEGYAPSGPVIWPPQAFKETQRSELIPGSIWGLEQVIAFFTVSANIRMTVVRMQDSKLWVCGPISPTRECLRLLDELGEVGHLVVPGTSLEHKASLAEFSRVYPTASVWVAPGQNTSPFDPALGSRVDGVLGQTGSPSPPWLSEIDAKVFYVAPPETAGTYSETAFFHKATRTLLLSDAVLKVPDLPPSILASYGFEGTAGKLTPQQWHYKYIAFNFLAMRGTNDADFQALARPPGIVSPILRFSLYPICQQQAAVWVKSVADWPFEHAVAAHLQSPFRLTPADFLDAFGFLFGKPSSYEPEPAQLNDLRSAAEKLDGPEALKSSIWTRFGSTV